MQSRRVSAIEQVGLGGGVRAGGFEAYTECTRPVTSVFLMHGVGAGCPGMDNWGAGGGGGEDGFPRFRRGENGEVSPLQRGTVIHDKLSVCAAGSRGLKLFFLLGYLLGLEPSKFGYLGCLWMACCCEVEF